MSRYENKEIHVIALWCEYFEMHVFVVVFKFTVNIISPYTIDHELSEIKKKN